MPKKLKDAYIEAWTFDQFAKSAHRKLHEWKLLEITDQINQVRGETLNWDNLNISEQAWNKVIHRGIKPVVVYAHPIVLQTVPGSAGYYRMLAMVSQKSMKQIGINLDSYEAGKLIPNEKTAISIAQHLNRIISALIEADMVIDAREFDLWRGMAAGSQAQGSWQNKKGVSAEVAIREVVLQRLQAQERVPVGETNAMRIDLRDGRVLVFADDPDLAIYEDNVPLVAVEIKGGIDPAGVLERIGAALKSLQRIRQENPNSVAVLILHDVSVTEQAKRDLERSTGTVTHLFSPKAILEDEPERDRFFRVLGI
ncbi:MAG: XcyI family restriction endonuclease [Chloroflexi bacterium CFX4]|nr:XcyI family restriction endonuclease [Chloroflexi bacterium CFX4]MDL1921513.1 XcyI family restriction endonuclease [Chloroflexi bacterium CFX3]